MLRIYTSTNPHVCATHLRDGLHASIFRFGTSSGRLRACCASPRYWERGSGGSLLVSLCNCKGNKDFMRKISERYVYMTRSRCKALGLSHCRKMGVAVPFVLIYFRIDILWY